MELEILLSCMHQEDMSIIEKSRITGDVLIINQTDEEKEVSGKTKHGTARMICTRERGLSRSRNMAFITQQHLFFVNKLLHLLDERVDLLRLDACQIIAHAHVEHETVGISQAQFL